MTNKFKVGDKARITGNTNDHNFKIGEIVILRDFINNVWECHHLDRRDFWYVKESDMEPIEPTEQPTGKPLTLQEKFEQGWEMKHNYGNKVTEIVIMKSGKIVTTWENMVSIGAYDTESEFLQFHTITPPAPKVERSFTAVYFEDEGEFYCYEDCETLEEAKEAVNTYNRDDVYPTCILEHEKVEGKWKFIKAHEV